MRHPFALLPAAALLSATAFAQTCTRAIYYGTGTPGTNGLTPAIRTVNEPLVPNAGFFLRGDQMLGGAACAYILGFQDQDFPFLGATILASPVRSAATIASTDGTASFPLPIPDNPNGIGIDVFAQMLVLDPGAPAGLAASDGLRFALCDPAVPVEVNLRQDANGVDATGWNVQDGSLAANNQEVGAFRGRRVWQLPLARIEVPQRSRVTRVRVLGVSRLEDYAGFANLQVAVYPDPPTGFGLDPFDPSQAVHFDNSTVSLSSTQPPVFGGSPFVLEGIPFRFLELEFTDFTLEPGSYWISIGRLDGIDSLAVGTTAVDLGTGSDAIGAESLPGYSLLSDILLAPTNTLALDVFAIVGVPERPESGMLGVE